MEIKIYEVEFLPSLRVVGKDSEDAKEKAMQYLLEHPELVISRIKWICSAVMVEK